MPTDPKEKPQIDKFRDLARELEADEDETRFEGIIKRVAKNPPKRDKPPESG